MDGYRTNTFAVRLSGFRSRYKVGDIVTSKALVTRRITGADLGPAEGVTVIILITVGRVTVSGAGLTDDAGVVEIPVRLRRYLPGGRADVSAIAVKELENVPCHEYEWGRQDLLRLFEVTR